MAGSSTGWASLAKATSSAKAFISAASSAASAASSAADLYARTTAERPPVLTDAAQLRHVYVLAVLSELVYDVTSSDVDSVTTLHVPASGAPYRRVPVQCTLRHVRCGHPTCLTLG